MLYIVKLTKFMIASFYFFIKNNMCVFKSVNLTSPNYYSSLIFSNIGKLKLASLFTIRFSTYIFSFELNGAYPVKRTYAITPIAQTSTF